MDDVIENCATTFEEDGVNQQTLDDIRKVGGGISLFLSLFRIFQFFPSMFRFCIRKRSQYFHPHRVFHYERWSRCYCASWANMAERHCQRLWGHRRGVENLAAFWGNAQHLTHFKLSISA